MVRVGPLLLAGLGAFALGPACAKKPVPDLGPRWDDGAHYAFQATVDSKTEMGKGNVLIDFHMTGKMDLYARKLEGGGVRLGARLQDVRVEGTSSGGDTNLTGLSRELEQPWFATLRDGRLEALHIKRGSAAAAVGIERTLSAALQFASPDGSAKGGDWIGVEHDATGRYQASYRALPEPGHFSKRKLRYDTLLFGVSGVRPGVRLGTPAAGEVPAITASSGEVEIAADGVLRSARVDDEVTGQLAAGAPIASKSSLALTRLTMDRTAAPPELAGPGGDFLALQAADPYAPPAPRLENDAAKMAGWTFEKAVAEIEQLEATRPAIPAAPAGGAPEAQSAEQSARAQRMGNAFMALSAMFRKDPATIRRANTIIRKDGVVASALVDAVSSAGTPFGQATLLELATDAKLPLRLREAAAGSLIRSDRPSPETVAGLGTRFDDPVIGVHAIYGLGTFARKLRNAGQAQLANEISQLLVQRLAAVREQPDKVRAMRGIANSAWVGALPAVRPYLDNRDPYLRAGAVEALRLMDAPEIDGLIAARMADKELVPRNAALSAATPRPPSPVLIAAVAELASKASDTQGRMQAVRLLVRWLPARGAAVRPTLEQIAASDKEPKVREEARRAVDQRTL
jgi:hypothetical protein